jgi:predicted  nucleic acid-binding Zn-ribbon protein
MYICPWPGCGNVFPSGQKIPDVCPNCGESPFADKDEEGQLFTYAADEIKGRRILLGVQR